VWRLQRRGGGHARRIIDASCGANDSRGTMESL
jgi:hypothetical protein